MNATYAKYRLSGQTGPQEIIERKTIELPEDGHGIRYHLRKTFPGFKFSRQTCGGEDFRMHDAEWKTGVAIWVK